MQLVQTWSHHMLSFSWVTFKKDSDSDITPLVWWRYIDEIFMLWQHGEKELKKF